MSHKCTWQLYWRGPGNLDVTTCFRSIPLSGLRGGPSVPGVHVRRHDEDKDVALQHQAAPRAHSAQHPGHARECVHRSKPLPPPTLSIVFPYVGSFPRSLIATATLLPLVSLPLRHHPLSSIPAFNLHPPPALQHPQPFLCNLKPFQWSPSGMFLLFGMSKSMFWTTIAFSYQ